LSLGKINFFRALAVLSNLGGNTVGGGSGSLSD
jgi:hypothetical protein